MSLNVLHRVIIGVSVNNLFVIFGQEVVITKIKLYPLNFMVISLLP